KLGQVEPAMKLLDKAMRLDPSYEEPFFFYADLLVRQGKNEEAIPHLRTALRNRPDYVPARVLLARAQMHLQHSHDAPQELTQAVELAPRHPQPHLLLSQIYYRLGEEDKARLEKELSLKLRRENPALLEAVQGRPFE